MLNIAIIGGGLSGTLVALHLLKQQKLNATIYLIEAQAQQMLRGVAYACPFRYELLNVPVGRMSIDSQQPNDFYNWLIDNRLMYAEIPDTFDVNSFISRRIYGKYLEDRLNETLQKTNSNLKLSKIYREVIDIQAPNKEDKLIVQMKDRVLLYVDKVILATGNLAPTPLPIKNADFYQSLFYFNNPWAVEAMQSVKQQDAILLLGTGLTTIDWAISLYLNGHQGKIYALSRKGLLPQTRHESQTWQFPTINWQNPPTLLEYFKFIRQEVKKAQAQNIHWQSVLESMRTLTPKIWQSLSLFDKKQFLRHLKSYWESHRHRLPPESAILLQKMQRQGILTIFRGRLQDLNINDKSVVASIQLYNKPHKTQLYIKRVINCTGPQTSYFEQPQNLLFKLKENGLVVPDELNWGILTNVNGEVKQSNEEVNENMFALGALRKGSLWETNALTEIRGQAERIAQIIAVGS